MAVFYFFIVFYLSKKAKRWPKTMGEILFSEVTSSVFSPEDPHRITYKAKIKYQYQVQDKIYVSDKICYGDWIFISSSSYARKLVNKHQIGNKCIVHYNSQKPQNAVLETAISSPVRLLLFCGILFLLADFVMLLLKETIILYSDK